MTMFTFLVIILITTVIHKRWMHTQTHTHTHTQRPRRQYVSRYHFANQELLKKSSISPLIKYFFIPLNNYYVELNSTIKLGGISFAVADCELI